MPFFRPLSPGDLKQLVAAREEHVAMVQAQIRARPHCDEMLSQGKRANSAGRGNSLYEAARKHSDDAGALVDANEPAIVGLLPHLDKVTALQLHLVFTLRWVGSNAPVPVRHKHSLNVKDILRANSRNRLPDTDYATNLEMPATLGLC